MSILNGPYFNLRKRFRRLSFIINEKISAYDITPEQVMILEVLLYNKDITNSELANFLGLDYTTVCRCLIRLKNRKYINYSIYKNLSDGRNRYKYSLSSDGKALLKKVSEPFKEAEKEYQKESND